MKKGPEKGEIVLLSGGGLLYEAGGVRREGPLEPVLDSLGIILSDQEIEEVMFNSPAEPVRVYHRVHGMMVTDLRIGAEQLPEVIRGLMGEDFTHDFSKEPIFDGVLPDGSRINVTFPPVALKSPNFTIRKFRKVPITPLDLIRDGSLSPDCASFLWCCIDGRMGKASNILLAGGAGTGKTTNLSALSLFIPLERRIVVIEDTPELSLSHGNVVRMVTGRDHTMDDLVKNAMRMRPERIFVGEVRGGEARTLFNAMYTGTDGIMGTLHATSSLETVNRIKNPPMSVPISEMAGLDLILVCGMVKERERTLRFIREVSEIAGVQKERARFNLLYRRDPEKGVLAPTGIPSRLVFRLCEGSGIEYGKFMKEMGRRRQLLDELAKSGAGAEELLKGAGHD